MSGHNYQVSWDEGLFNILKSQLLAHSSGDMESMDFGNLKTKRIETVCLTFRNSTNHSDWFNIHFNFFSHDPLLAISVNDYIKIYYKYHADKESKESDSVNSTIRKIALKVESGCVAAK